MISILILTKNEEINIARCIDSVAWSDDVVVFDSNSTDRTCEIAERMGARVFRRPFDTYSAQREAARQVEYRYPWVLALDADEQPDKELIDEIRQLVSSSPAHSAYRVRHKDYFMGRWTKHSSLYPSWILRFYRHDKIYYEPRAVHEYPTVDGTVGELKGHLLHDSFSKGIDEWLAKHVRYAHLEAQEDMRSLRRGSLSFDMFGLFSIKNPVRRRRALKELSFRLPFRPVLRFVYMYFLRLGFLDGLPGYRYCRMLAIYESMIVLQINYLKYQASQSDQ